MSGSEHQVVSMYELGSMSPGDISESTGYDLLAIKTTLASHSKIYRERMEQTALVTQANGTVVPSRDEGDISDSEMAMIKSGILDIAFNAPEEQLNTKFRALKFLFQEKKGRNNVATVSSIKINMLTINQGLQQAREAMERAMNNSNNEKQVIEA